MLRRFFGFSIIPLLALACSHDETASAKTRDGHSVDDGVAPRPSVISPASEPYKVSAVATPSTITGTVDFDGTPPSPEVVQPTVDQGVCGKSIVAKNVTLSGTRVADAVVWLTDIRSGKAFPLERRFDLTNNDCMLDPYVQAITTNSTLNVGNDDRTLQTNRFINVGTGKIIAFAPFNDDGEVVPVDRLREPAEVEVVSEQHPWTHAWIAVLDHPYFAQTDSKGAFSIAGVPPGKYRMRAWHPALGFADDSLTVAGGQQVSIAFRIRRTAPATPAVIAPADTNRAPSTPAVPILPTSSSTPAASSTSSSTPPPGR
jgi:hypothetical protein